MSVLPPSDLSRGPSREASRDLPPGDAAAPARDPAGHGLPFAGLPGRERPARGFPANDLPAREAPAAEPPTGEPMVSEFPAKYVDDVSYVNLFHRHATPAWLHFIAGALGHGAPDPGSPFRWCELGCGPGYGTVLTAAANPRGHFVGIDFNAAHIAHAKALATQGGVTNTSFLERDLQSLVGAAASTDPLLVEGFDFISVVGVYAWVAPADRRAVLAFVSRFLKPGGMLYMTYSCHPGMSWFVGMQRLLVDYAATVRGSSADKIVASLRFLQELAGAEGSQLAEHPAQLAEIARALEGDPRYLAHEFMAPHWAPQQVGEVIGDLARLGCTWLGSAQPGDNIDEFSLAPALRPLLASLPAGAMRETARALAIRQSMRHDIFQRGAQTMSQDDHRHALMTQRLAQVPGVAHALPSAFDARLRPDAPWGGLLAPALAVLKEQGPQSFAHLSRHAAFKNRVGVLNPVFQLLAHAGLAHPMLSAAGDGRRAHAFNRAISEAVMRGEDYGWLAAPAIGSAIRVDPWQMALANALLTSPALRWDALLQAVATRLETLRTMSRRGQALAPSLPSAATLPGALRDAMRNVVPSWRALGVIAG